MEQNTRPAPDTDLEAYGDWVTVDTAVPPTSVVRQPPAAAADVEIAGELTEAEEEFLGELSDADHSAAAAAAATAATPDRGHPVHNGNGNGSADSAIGHGAPDRQRTGRGRGLRSGTTRPVPCVRDGACRERGGGHQRGGGSTGDSGSAASRGAGAAAGGPGTAAAGPGSRQHRSADTGVLLRNRSRARRKRRRTSRPGSIGSGTRAPAQRSRSEPDPASVEEAGRDTLAGLETRVAALAADLTEIAAQVARLQPAGAADTPAAAAEPGQPAAADSDPLQVSIEEIDAGQPAESGSPAPTNALAEAAAHDSHPAPMIRLVPIADEQDAPSADPAAGAATEGAAEEVHAEAPPHDASPEPSPDVFRNNVRAVLAYLDQLLDDLPPERVREFAQSPQFATYKALFAELGLDDE